MDQHHFDWINSRFSEISDRISELEKMLDRHPKKQLNIPVVISSTSELAQKFKEYAEKLLLSKKDTVEFLIKTGIIDKDWNLTEHYKTP